MSLGGIPASLRKLVIAEAGIGGVRIAEAGNGGVGIAGSVKFNYLQYRYLVVFF